MPRVEELWKISWRRFEVGWSLLKVVKVNCNSLSLRHQTMEILGKKTFNIPREDIPNVRVGACY
jgi:hypothetical protein